jgi:hypothetical protein
MSDTTENLNLFKYNVEEDANLPFSITNALNNNWDIIDSSIPTKTSQLTNDSGFLTQHQDLSNYVKKSDANTISGATTFTGTTKVPNSATVGTAVSTAAISKATNGYVKFGNGIQLCWGTYADGTNNFSVAFASKVSIAVCGEYSWNQVTKITKLTVSNFTVETDASSSQSPVKRYIAIGY